MILWKLIVLLFYHKHVMVLGFMTEIFSLVFLSITHSSGHICICYVMILKKDIKTVM
jgi:hypothetical protein